MTDDIYHSKVPIERAYEAIEVDAPVRCVKCKKDIEDGTIYYHDKNKGFICELCPGFEAGGLEPIKEAGGG